MQDDHADVQRKMEQVATLVASVYGMDTSTVCDMMKAALCTAVNKCEAQWGRWPGTVADLHQGEPQSR